MTRFATLIALAAAVVPACSAQSPELPGAPDPAVLDEFQAALRDWASDPGHYGVSAAVIFPNGAEWAGVGGVAGADEPLRPEDLIWIASITKTMTGAVILQLVEEGSFSTTRTGCSTTPGAHRSARSSRPIRPTCSRRRNC